MDERLQSAPVYHLAHLPRFLDGMFDEFLATVTGIDGHEEHHVNIFQNVFEEADGRMRIEGDPGLHPRLANGVYRAVQVRASLVVDIHHIRPARGQLGDELLRLDNHQVHVHLLLAQAADGLENGDSDGDIGHEYAVHHVEVQPVCLAAVYHLDVSLQVQKVCREERRSNQMFHSLR